MKARMTMMLTDRLTPAEQEKVERLDAEIATKFIQAGLNVRIICEGHGAGNNRVLEFKGLVDSAPLLASIRAEDFLSLSDEAAVVSIKLLRP